MTIMARTQPDRHRAVAPAPPGGAAAGPPAEWRWPAVHREGWRLMAPVAAVAGVALLFGWTVLFALAALLGVALALFFRDPERVPPPGDSLVLAPADGLVAQIAEVEIPRQLVGDDGLEAGTATRISIFLSVFDVHVNRTPVAGIVRRQVYVPGVFRNASLDEASEDNERNYVVVETLDGLRVGFAQIAGLVARRIVSFVKPGDMLAPGQRFGLIRFGSRCDVFLPPGHVPAVLKGQRVVAGETVVGRPAP